MFLARLAMDYGYGFAKPFVFFATREDPEVAHESLVRFSRFLNRNGLDKPLFDNYLNSSRSNIEISNAAGFNKNGDIPPQFLNYLGFDRVVVGTVTGEPWAGNPRPRIKRYPETNSMVNWMGLPGIGAEAVADNLSRCGAHEIPLTINLMATPKKEGDALLQDLEKTVLSTRNVYGVDRFELNISCPNTHVQGFADAREAYRSRLDDMLDCVKDNLLYSQQLWLKVSPDQDSSMIDDIVERSFGKVRGFTTTNTTIHHDPHFIKDSPKMGGASGRALYTLAVSTQDKFLNSMRSQKKDCYDLIACGGIESVEALKERTDSPNVKGIQIFTPLIFKGPALLTKFRRHLLSKV